MKMITDEQAAAIIALVTAAKEYRKRYGNCGALIQQQAADALDSALLAHDAANASAMDTTY